VTAIGIGANSNAAESNVERPDQLEPRRKRAWPPIRATETTSLERLAQRLEYGSRELGQLVEQQHASARECAGMSLETQASVRRMKTFNLNSDEWDATRDRDGWRCSGTLVGKRIGGELLGATMSQIEPGSRLWPYHTHYLNEEWVIVLRGEPTLRTPEGEHVLEEGDIVCFPRGKIGAHQISNRTDSPVRVLMLSSMIRGEIIEYLDTGKVLAKDVDDEDVMFARPGPAVEYWEGED
jgi:uncharacterized cupin superfamily protein